MESAIQMAKVLFFHMRPERVMRAYARYHMVGPCEKGLINRDGLVRFEVFEQAAASEIPNLSYEELLGLYEIMRTDALERKQLVCTGRLFAPLLLVADELLAFDSGRPYCRLEKALNWRDITLALGQDAITTASLAWRDCHSQIKHRQLDWPPALLPDRVELRRFLTQGLVENHAHLKGSSQSFAVTLAYCSNHLASWDKVEAIIDRGMVSRPHFDTVDNAETWRTRLCRIASLRVTLFLRTLRGHVPYGHGVNWSLSEHDVEKLLDLTRFQYGLSVEDTAAPLDYALHYGLSEYANSPYRLLVAERSLLYACFREVFTGAFTEEECVGLYVYLLLKAQLRGEFIQVNNRFGFHNFLRYENRKDVVFEADDAYVREQNRIAVRGAFDCSVKGMEARLAPGDSARKNGQKIDAVLDAANLQENDPPLFFVFHFIKTPDLDKDITELERNHETRDRVWTQADALAQLFAEEPERKEQVLGVDAASTEIGCRPEVFAPAFGFLRGWLEHLWSDALSLRFNLRHYTPWRTTYHAGEDFHDLVDGIRAVDEALRFLHMRRGDRIGHALATGVNPKVHARNKDYRSIVSKQDQLDNDVWLLRFAREEGIYVDSRLRHRLEQEAIRLLMEIYGSRGLPMIAGGADSPTALEYYARAWILREDPPSWYRTGEFKPNRLISRDWPETDGTSAQGGAELAYVRKDSAVVRYYHQYHWNPDVRKRGAQMIENVLLDDYLELVGEIQDALLRKMARTGIIVECNPSSNCVIGSFREYVQHPLFRMMDVRADGASGDRLVVTVNTDDIGVFDTTLQNEYVLLAAAMAERDRHTGDGLEDSMHRLEELRRNGYLASFSEKVRMSY